MGWQDRDYARLNDDELDELYRVRRGGTSERRVVWPLLAVAATAVLGFGYHERGVVTGGVAGAVNDAPPVLFGTLVKTGPLSGNVCTELEYLSVSRSWRCDVYLVNATHAPVYPATPYNGECAHLKVQGRDWVCLSAVPPAGAGT